MIEQGTGAARTLGRPRSTRAHEAIIQAVLDLWEEGVSFDALSMEAVAARAGVGKATIYRRWPNKQALLADVMIDLKGPPPQPVGETMRDQLISILSRVGAGDERASKIFPCLLPELKRSEEAHRLWQEVMVEPRRKVFRAVLQQGVESGQLSPDVDLEVVTALLISPVLLHRMLRWNPSLDDDLLPAQVVDMVLAGARAVVQA